MELLDRYLQAVKKHLPWQRQDDILAELRANLESQLEDKEAELGRPLTTSEVEAWLKQIGPPMQVAARYQPQQYLIGPAVFPTYWYVLRLAFFWATDHLRDRERGADCFRGQPRRGCPAGSCASLAGRSYDVAAWVTLTFAAIEFAVVRYPGRYQSLAVFTPINSIDWTPSTLPPVEKTPAGGKKPRSFAQAVAEVVFGFLFLIWLLLVPQHPFLLWGPGVIYMHLSPFQLAPVWMQFFWWIVALNVLQLAWRCLDLWQGAWQRPRQLQQIVFKVIGLIPLLFLLNVPNQACLTLKHPALDQARYGGTLVLINRSIHLSLLCVCAIVVLQLLWETGQMGLNTWRKRAAAMP